LFIGLFFFSLNVNILNILGFMDVYATFLKLNAAFSDNIAKFMVNQSIVINRQNQDVWNRKK